MPISGELMSIIGPALGAMVGISFYFGKHHVDKSAKFDDPNQTKEFNDLRLQIRNTETLPVIDKLWNHLNYVHDEKTRNLDSNNPIDIKATDIAYDSEHRHKLNDILNEIAGTIKNDLDVKNAWHRLADDYKKVGHTLFILSGIAGSGFGTLVFNWRFIDDPSIWYIFYPWFVQVGTGLGFLSKIVFILYKLKPVERLYSEQKRKYLTDKIRIE